MKRSGPLPRKRAKKRRTLSPRCARTRCNKPARVGEWCRTHAIAECDRRARAVAREIRACTRCGSTDGLQWSHHISRARHRIRWDARNATMHCAPCHALFTNHGALHTDWIIRHVGVDVYAELMDIAYGPIDPDDPHGKRVNPGTINDYEIAAWLEELPPIEEVAA